MNRAGLTLGICLVCFRGRHFSPSLPDRGPAQGRGPTGIWNLAHSISDPWAEISAILVVVPRSSTTSRGFCFTMSRLSGLRMRNISDLMCIPKSRETKAVKQLRKGQARSQIPVYKAFNMVVAMGWRSTTLWVRRVWANFKVKTYGFKKKLFCSTI